MAGCNEDKYMNLRGRVVDRFSNKPLAGVTVEVGNRLIETNVNGCFLLKNIPVVEDVAVEDRMVKVAAPGYRVYAKPLLLEEGDKMIEIRLKDKREAKFFFVSDKEESRSIYLGDIYGKEEVKLTDDKGNDWAPCWSNKRNELLFLSDRDGNSNIYVMDIKDKKIRQVTFTTTEKESPVWMSGDKILFASNRDGDYDIYQMDLAGNYLKRLTNNDYYDGQIAYSLQCDEIAYISKTTGQSKLHIMKGDGRYKVVLNSDFGEDAAPSWTDDGERILFINYGSGQSHIYELNPNGSGLNEILGRAKKIYNYSFWHQEGSLLLYSIKKDSKCIRLFINGGEDRKVLVGDDINYSDVEWKN